MIRAKAFTLIELLVVVAIIVALLAILLPSMNRAIEIAEIAACGSNERQQITGMISFASDSFGQLPPYRSNSTASAGLPWNLYVAYTGRNLNIQYNLANLQTGYIPDPRVYYCPSGTYNKYAAFDYYDLPWGEAFPSGDSSIRVGYMYNPDKVRTIADAATSRGVATVDLLHFTLVNQHPPTWNLGRFDGSVSSASSSEVQQRMDYTYQNGLPNPGNNWAEFNQLLDTLLQSN